MLTYPRFTHLLIGRQHERVDRDKKTPPQHNKYNAADAFRLATLGGAEAINMSHLIGTVEVGKKADLVIFDTTSANLAGISNPFQGVVFHASNADVETVLVDGEVVKRDGKLTKVQWGPVAKELREKADRIRERHPESSLEALWAEYYTKFGGPLWT